MALGTALALGYGDEAAGALAGDLLPAVQVAAKFAANRPDERFWALVTLAECALHQHMLDGSTDLGFVETAYQAAGAELPPDGDLESPLTQLEFLARLGLPQGPVTAARRGLLNGATRQS